VPPPEGPGAFGHSPPFVLAQSVRMLVNLDLVPRPSDGWAGAIGRAWPGMLALAALVLWGAWASRREVAHAAAPVAPGRVALFGAVWALLGWLPLLSPWVRWHPYYGLLGALGAWLAIGALVSRFTVPVAALVAALALLRAGQAYTPWLDWWTEWLEHRAGDFLAVMRDDLRRVAPHPAPHSRLWFVQVPSYAGFLTEGAPVLRVWYGDTTLTGGFFRDYHPRVASSGEPVAASGERVASSGERAASSGYEDRFFRFDSLGGWVELKPGDTTSTEGGEAWASGLRELAATFATAGEWSRAAVDFERVARARPDQPWAAIEAGVARGMAGDTAAALAWVHRADAMPGAPDSVRRAARELEAALAPRPARGR